MNDATATSNPMIAEMSVEALMAEIAARGVKVAPVVEKAAKPAKVELTEAEVLVKIAEAVAAVIPVQVEGEAPVVVDHDLIELRTVLVAKWRTTTAKQEAAKRPAPTGKKRGRKSEAEKKAEADAAALAANGGTPTPEGTEPAPEQAPEA